MKLSRQALTELKHYSEDTFIDETHLSIIHGKVLLSSSTFQLFSRVLCHNSLGRSNFGNSGAEDKSLRERRQSSSLPQNSKRQ